MSETTDIPKGYKATEFGALPKEWNIISLGEIAEYINGYGFEPSEWQTTGLPIIRIQNLTKTSNVVNYYDGELDEKYRVKSGDLLISWSASLGTYIWDGPDAWLNQHIFKVTNYSKNLDKDYFFYRITQDIESLKSKSRGSTMKHITKKEFLAIKILLPPLPEQHAIAHVLRTVQETKERTDAVIAATKALKAAMMRHLFKYGPVPPEEAERVALKETEIGVYPEQWRDGRFDEFIILQRGFDITKNEQRDGIVPVVSSSGIKSYHNKSRANGPGVVIGRKGTLGKVFYVDCNYWPHDTSLWVKDFKGNNPKFVYYLLTTLNLKTLDTGTSNPTLNRNYVHALKIAMPHFEDQKIIVNIISTIDQKLTAEQSRRQVLDTLFATLLHDLMTAKIRINNSENNSKRVITK